MLKKMIVIISFCFFFLNYSIVFALENCSELEKRSFTLCANGCDYDNVADLLSDNQSSECPYDILVKVEDSGTYDFYQIEGSANRFAFEGKEDSKPTISFPQGESNIYSIKNIKIDNTLIQVFKGVTIDNVEANNELNIYAFENDVKLVNSKIFKSLEIGADDGKIILDNVDVKGMTKTFGETYIDNSKFGDELRIIGGGHVKDSIVNIESKQGSKYGIVLHPVAPEVCNGYQMNPSLRLGDRSFSIDNVSVHGASEFGIHYETGEKLYSSFEVKNCDLVDNVCSFGVETFEDDMICSFMLPNANNPFDKYQANYLNRKNYNVLIENTKINCASSIAKYNINTKPVVYVTSNNTWSKKVIRTATISDLNDEANVIEIDGGVVLIEYTNSDEVDLNDKELKSLISYFKQLKDADINSIKWEVVDKDILEIENGFIKPLKVGETDVIATYNNDDYSLHIKVKSLGIVEEVAKAIQNPDTRDHFIIVIVLCIVSLGCFLVNRYFGKKRTMF